MAWAIMLGWLFYAEAPDGFTIAGVLLIAFSGLFTMLREEQIGGWWNRMVLLRNRP
jgi:S-adenosylmethionine uptake transporter